jgi:hypothetical protein
MIDVKNSVDRRLPTRGAERAKACRRMNMGMKHWKSTGSVVIGLLSFLQGTPAGLASSRAAEKTSNFEGITFAGKPGTLYVGVREAAEALDLPVHWEGESRNVFVNNKPLDRNDLKWLPEGNLLVPVRDLEPVGVTVVWDGENNTATLSHGTQQIQVHKGRKRVEIDKNQQELRAWQGKRLVMKSKISTGKMGHRTPNGTYRAGPIKARMLRSRLYNDAPMPWSVQVTGNYLIHGYPSVPNRPASHGCIRMPLEGGNPAKWFYHWVDIGTPIRIKGRWRNEISRQQEKHPIGVKTALTCEVRNKEGRPVWRTG